MRKNKFTIFLLASVVSLNLFTVSPTTEASENLYNNYSFGTDYSGNNSVDSTVESSNLEKPGANATTEDVAQYVRDSLNSNAPLGTEIRLKGKKQNADGSYSVAIRYDNEDTKKNIVINLDSTGSATTTVFTNAEDSAKLQALYDEITYDQSSYTANAIDNLDTILHENNDTYMGSLADFLGVDVATATSTAAGAMSVAGIAILGAGTNSEKKKMIFEQAKTDYEKKKNQENKNTSKNDSNINSNDSSNIQRRGAGVYVDCSSGGVDSLTIPTQNFLNTLSANFYEKTGVILNVTSTLRPDDSGSWHSEGIAFDVANDEFYTGANGYSGWDLRNLYGQMAREMGGTPLDEYPGGEGEQYARGSNYHITVHNQDDWA